LQASLAPASAGAPLPGHPEVPAVTRLALSEFRSYRRLRLEPAAGPVVLTGPNGAGKTNLLEALSFLSPGRGLRGARLGEVKRREAAADAAWAVSAGLLTRAGIAEVSVGLAVGDGPEGAADRRAVRLDGKAASGVALGALVGVHWLTPAMDRLFVEGAAGRRRFLDRLVFGFDAEHARRVAQYERALRERSRLLLDGVGDRAWLGAVEGRMAELGVAVAAARREAVARLARGVEGGSGPFPRPAVRVEGTLEGWLEGMPAVEAEGRFAAALQRNRGRDAESGGAAEGPHRSDLAVDYADKGVPAAACSTGEQKALLIAIVLAEARLERARRGQPPLLLLDEVAAHLDEGRRAALFDEVVALGGQPWLTGTDRALFGPLAGRATFYRVADGRAALEEE